MTRWLLGSGGLHRLAELAGRDVLIVLDFDGTLAPIVERRDRARLRATTRRLLAEAALLYPVAVVSGRSRADVTARLDGLRLCAVVGNHGSEADSGSVESPRTRRWLARLERELSGLPGVEIEDKGRSLSVHFRRAPTRAGARRAIVDAVDALDGARRVDGHEVVNVVARGAPDKGTAIRKLWRARRADGVIFVGDDITDEDGFALAGPDFCAVRVGATRRTAATHHLKKQAEIDRLLAELIRLRKPKGRRSVPRAAGALLALSLAGCDATAPRAISGEPAKSGAAGGAPAPPAGASLPGRTPLNVLLIMIDSWRSDVSWTGYPRPTTPRIDAFRKEHCVAYTNGYSLSSYTAKSVVPALVGEYPSAMRRDAHFFTRYPDHHNLFVSERAQAAGHRTLSAQAHGYYHPMFWTTQGFDVHRTLPGGVDLAAVTSVTSEALTTLTKRVLGELRAKPLPRDKRFFAFAHYMDPHHTYEQHKGVERFGLQPRDLYDHEVLHTDRFVGDLLDFAKQQPWWSETAVIITADHGEAFGERDHNRHGHELWESIVRVPWLLCWPGVRPGTLLQVRRSHIDLAPTIADLMGLPADPPFRGTSLVPEVLGVQAPAPRRIVVDQPRADLMDRRRAAIDGNWKIVAFGDDRAFFLFDLEADPWEKRDLAASRPEELSRMKRVYEQASREIPLVEVDRGPDLKGAPRGRRW